MDAITQNEPEVLIPGRRPDAELAQAWAQVGQGWAEGIYQIQRVVMAWQLLKD